MDQAPAKSTACDGLRNRSHKFFEDLYFTLVKYYHSFLSDSRTFGLTFKEVLIIDSTTIRLFSDILKGVSRNPKGDGKKKGGMKVYMLIDAVQLVGRFIKMTAAKVNDQKFLKSLGLISDSMIVFSVVASLVRIHLISNLDVNELLRSTKRKFKSKSIPPGLQLSFNMQEVSF
jgi:hypothetical protein